MSLLDDLASVIAPHECLGCDKQGDLLCKDCADLLPTIPERCYRCHKLSSDFRVCSSCRHASRITKLRVYTDYDFVAKALVSRLKYEGAQSAAKITATLMAGLIEHVEDQIILVPVPTATRRRRQRGYDQAKLIARQLAKQSRLPYGDYLARIGQARQVGASRRQRLVQLEGAFRVKSITPLDGAHVMLVDDVLTTGATLEAASKILKQAGAKHVEAIVFAQA